MITGGESSNSGTGRWPVIRWSPKSVDLSINPSLVAPAGIRGRPDLERRQAMDWLRQALAGGPRLSMQIRDEGQEQGFCHRTLCRAFRDLGGQAVRFGGAAGFWEWKLPVKECQKSGG